MAPLAVDPRSTAAACPCACCPSGGGTGIIPRACRAGNDPTGSWTGMAPLGRYGEWVVVAVAEAGVVEATNVATVEIPVEGSTA